MAARAEQSTHQAGRRSPGRPKGGDSGLSEDQIVAAAERAIRQHGAQTTLDQIATEAGVTKPVLYRVVGDRAAIASSLSAALTDRINATVAAAGAGGTDPERVFHSIVRGFLEVVDADREIFLFVSSGGLGDDEARRLIDLSANPLAELFASAGSHQHSPTAARTWAYSVVGAFQTVSAIWVHDEFTDIDQLATDLMAFLWPSLERAIAPLTVPGNTNITAAR